MVTKPATLRRVQLDDDNWADLETRPTGRDMLLIQSLPESLATNGKSNGVAAEYHMLPVFIREWSFDSPITTDALLDLGMDDLLEIMMVFNDEVVPFLDRFQQRLTRKGYLPLSDEKKSRQTMPSSTSSTPRAGRGKSTKTRRGRSSRK